MKRRGGGKLVVGLLHSQATYLNDKNQTKDNDGEGPPDLPMSAKPSADIGSIEVWAPSLQSVAG